jgi:hypothetical protein
VPLEDHEECHGGDRKYAGTGQDGAERVCRGCRYVRDVVGQRHREWLLGLLLGDEKRPEELIPGADEGE